MSPSVLPYLHNPSKVTGVWKNGQLTLWTDSEFTRSMLNKPAILEGLARAAGDAFGGQPRVSIVAGRPPEEDLSPAPSQPSPQSKGSGDALDQLLAFGEKFDNIIIQ